MAAMALGDLPHQAQAQPDAAGMLGVAGHAVEGFEDALALVLGHARATVAHAHHRVLAFDRHADLDRLAAAVAARVLEQVAQRAAQQALDAQRRDRDEALHAMAGREMQRGGEHVLGHLQFHLARQLVGRAAVHRREARQLPDPFVARHRRAVQQLREHVGQQVGAGGGQQAGAAADRARLVARDHVAGLRAVELVLLAAVLGGQVPFQGLDEDTVAVDRQLVEQTGGKGGSGSTDDVHKSLLRQLRQPGRPISEQGMGGHNCQG